MASIKLLEFKEDLQQSKFFHIKGAINEIFDISKLAMLKMAFQFCGYPLFCIHFRANPAHLLHLFPAMNKNMFHDLLDVEPWQSSVGSSLVDSRNRKSRANKNRSRKWKNFKYLKASKKFSSV